jgi:hypothetical protein
MWLGSAFGRSLRQGGKLRQLITSLNVNAVDSLNVHAVDSTQTTSQSHSSLSVAKWSDHPRQLYFFMYAPPRDDPDTGAPALPPRLGAPAVDPPRTDVDPLPGAIKSMGATSSSLPRLPTLAVTIDLFDAREDDLLELRAESLAIVEG